MVKKVSLLCFVLVLVVNLAGCCDEEKCKAEFDLSKCTREECNQNYGSAGGNGYGPTGPDVELGPGTGNVLVWEIDQVAATDGGTVFDRNNSATYCKLRVDFIGKEILDFKYKPTTQPTKRRAEEIHLVSGNIELKIKRASSGALDWWIKNKTTGQACTLVERAKPATITDVPSEFIGLTHAQPNDVFEEVYDKKDAEAIAFQVKH